MTEKRRARWSYHSGSWRFYKLNPRGRVCYLQYTCPLCGGPSLGPGMCDWCLEARGPEQLLAHRTVARLVRQGLLASLPDGVTRCVDCGDLATVWEHRDYEAPDRVEAACLRCNGRRGRANSAHERRIATLRGNVCNGA